MWRSLAIVLALAASVPARASAAEPPASGRVGAAVRSALAAGARTRVLVYFRTAPGTAAATPSGRRALATRRAAILASAGSEFTLRRSFTAVSAIAGDVSAEGVRRLLAEADVLRIDADAPGGAHLLESLPLAAVDRVKALGFTGANVTVAVIDSGLDRDHPDFAGDLADEACFCSGGAGCCPGGGTTQLGAGAAEDANGHGTNVTGIITSNGGVAPEGGAPAARIVAVRVLDAAGRFCCSSDILAALDWVLDVHPEVRVVNASLGTDALYAGTCDAADANTLAFAQAIDALRANGTLTFVSSGNQRSASQIAVPACVANAIAVGAVWAASLGSRTCRGGTDVATAPELPTCCTNSSVAVDLYAPGAFVTATGLNGGTSSYGGTSQASPIVAACAADLIAAAPGVTADALEAALESSPVMVTDPKNGRVFPRLDCEASLDAPG